MEIGLEIGETGARAAADEGDAVALPPISGTVVVVRCAPGECVQGALDGAVRQMRDEGRIATRLGLQLGGGTYHLDPEKGLQIKDCDCVVVRGQCIPQELQAAASARQRPEADGEEDQGLQTEGQGTVLVGQIVVEDAVGVELLGLTVWPGLRRRHHNITSGKTSGGAEKDASSGVAGVLVRNPPKNLVNLNLALETECTLRWCVVRGCNVRCQNYRSSVTMCDCLVCLSPAAGGVEVDAGAIVSVAGQCTLRDNKQHAFVVRGAGPIVKCKGAAEGETNMRQPSVVRVLTNGLVLSNNVRGEHAEDKESRSRVVRYVCVLQKQMLMVHTAEQIMSLFQRMRMCAALSPGGLLPRGWSVSLLTKQVSDLSIRSRNEWAPFLSQEWGRVRRHIQTLVQDPCNLYS